MDLNTQEVHLSHYWNVIYKRWKVAVSILAVVMLGTYLASEFAKPLYKSNIQLQIERENPNQLTVDDLFGIAASDQEFLQTQYVLLKSRGLGEKVIEDEKLLSDPEVYPAGLNGKTPAQIAQIRSQIATTTRVERQNAYDALVHANPESVTSSDSLVVQLTEEESRKTRDYQQKLTTFKPDYPEMVSLKNSIDKTHQARTAAINAAFERAKDAAHRDLIAAQQNENQMFAALDTQKRETMSINTSAARYTDLTNSLTSKQSLLEQLEKRQNETEVTARLRGSTSSNNIHIVDHASFPTGRFNVMMKKNLQSAFPLGVVLGLAAIFFLEYMDRSIKTPEELERITKFASLGVIPAAGSVGSRSYYSSGYGHTTPKLRPVDSPVEPQSGSDR